MKSPAFQFYPKQWLGDDKIMLMDWDARAMHMHYMCIAWQQEIPCSLPDNDEILMKFLGKNSKKIKEKKDFTDRIKKQIFSAWTLKDGRWYQEGLLREYYKQQGNTAKRKMAADIRWGNKKECKSNAHALHMDMQMECSTITITDKDKKTTTNVVVKENRKKRLPVSFAVTEHHRELAIKNGWPSPDGQIEAFRDHHIGKGTTWADWDRAFYMWLRNAKKFNLTNNQGNNHARTSAADKSDQRFAHHVNAVKQYLAAAETGHG